ncbi:unnamed protein product [Acanthoscelides obtectus]|uniref:Uncharacterized protein n=1 Tax=Acanthoscelides obtectus TaxID=200917 RepID=A0A9P0JW18_ACAOB|nr:unnamed protein product [Acanthoscelides obtectus]CAK1642208.1 hypothetical protein AOBTE_LOCUS12886 [Acanthoscelides obtectus]
MVTNANPLGRYGTPPGLTNKGTSTFRHFSQFFSSLNRSKLSVLPARIEKAVYIEDCIVFILINCTDFKNFSRCSTSVNSAA